MYNNIFMVRGHMAIICAVVTLEMTPRIISGCLVIDSVSCKSNIFIK